MDGHRFGEHIDVELAATWESSNSYKIASSRRASGMVIPIVYSNGSIPVVSSPFVTPKPRGYIIEPLLDRIAYWNSGLPWDAAWPAMA
ncbi:MAG: hypothetical protein ABIJ86_05670 [Spirochaetota bacterium]